MTAYYKVYDHFAEKDARALFRFLSKRGYISLEALSAILPGITDGQPISGTPKAVPLTGVDMIEVRLAKPGYIYEEKRSLYAYFCRSVHAFIRTYIDVYTYIHSFIHSCMHTYIRSFIHTYIFIWIANSNIYIHMDN